MGSLNYRTSAEKAEDARVKYNRMGRSRGSRRLL